MGGKEIKASARDKDMVKPLSKPEKQCIKINDKKKKNALFMYVAIMFGIAFLLILMSYVISNRSSSQTIDRLNASSQSALVSIERLQDDYRRLYEENQALNAAMSELEQDLSDTEAVKNETIEAIKVMDSEMTLMDEELAFEQAARLEAEAEAERIAGLYELLWRASASYDIGDMDGFSEQMEKLDGLGAGDYFATGVDSQTGGSPAARYAQLLSRYREDSATADGQAD